MVPLIFPFADLPEANFSTFLHQQESNNNTRDTKKSSLTPLRSHYDLPAAIWGYSSAILRVGNWKFHVH